MVISEMLPFGLEHETCKTADHNASKRSMTEAHDKRMTDLREEQACMHS